MRKAETLPKAFHRPCGKVNCCRETAKVCRLFQIREFTWRVDNCQIPAVSRGTGVSDPLVRSYQGFTQACYLVPRVAFLCRTGKDVESAGVRNRGPRPVRTGAPILAQAAVAVLRLNSVGFPGRARGRGVFVGILFRRMDSLRRL